MNCTCFQTCSFKLSYALRTVSLQFIVMFNIVFLCCVLLCYSAFRKYSHPLTFSTFCCVNVKFMIVKFIKLRCVTGLQTIPHNVKVELCFSKMLQMNKKM